MQTKRVIVAKEFVFNPSQRGQNINRTNEPTLMMLFFCYTSIEFWTTVKDVAQMIYMHNSNASK